MKYYSKLTIALLLSSSLSVAQSRQSEPASLDKETQNVQTNDRRIEAGKKNYLMALRSDHDGLIESSIMAIIKLKIRYPSATLDEIKKVLDSLSLEGRTPAIRYKAYLGANVCENALWFAEETYLRNVYTDEFFVFIAQRLQAQLLGQYSK